MMKKKGKQLFTKKNMAIMPFVALGIQYVLPAIGIGFLGWLATLLILMVAVVLLVN